MDSKLEKYAEIQAMVQKDARDIAMQVYNELGTRTGVAKVPLHYHNGVDAPNIPATSIVQSFKASGSIRMATSGTRYTLGAPFKPTSVLFYGNVVHRTAGVIDIRAHVIGSAQLVPSYYYQPQSGASVKTGGPIQSVIQSGSYFMVNSTSGAVRTEATETHLISVTNPGIVARATIPDDWGGNGLLFVDVILDNDWEINGNFVVT